MPQYRIHHGHMRSATAEAGNFHVGLDLYKRLGVTSIDGCAITNDSLRCDEHDDGLTSEEREAIEAADVVIARWKRLRRRAADRLVEAAIVLFRAAPWSTEELRAGAEIEVARRRDPQLAEFALDRGLTIACPGVPWIGRSA